MNLADTGIYLTGANGWLGHAVLRVLLGDVQPDYATIVSRPIRCLIAPWENAADLSSYGDQIELIRGDMRNPNEIASFYAGGQRGILLHTAGTIHPRKVADFDEINCGGTTNVLNAAAAAGIERAVIISSNSPCGCNPNANHRFDESSPYNPYMGYGRSKMRMERAARQMHESGLLQTVVIRAPWFYGPDQPRRQTQFFRMIRNGTFPIVGSGHNVRSMVHTHDLARGLLLAATNDKALGEIYWMADEQPYTMNHIVATVKELLEGEFQEKCSTRQFRVPHLVGDVATVCDASLQALGIYNQQIHVLSEMNKNIACDITKAKIHLGFHPRIGLRDGMRQSLIDIYTRFGRDALDVASRAS